MSAENGATALVSEAAVATDRPERYGSQLVRHFANRVETHWADGRGEVRFSASFAGRAELRCAPGVLHIRVSAPDGESLRRVREVVADHLVRFGQRDRLVVTWT
ncbi:DUF2218 domain-containing protein [Goodfellowiella coeruleoviolacea]|uniref:DUF2218 domain-containing protein n=1 Tax=Goodfellowiella coeruleoviolacea TaxID=334858 RepID=A0AAE3GHR7_9PSEU|nr:DUF2218 domain-containing protein [Goodfellowiella coeruleoviolacea]MCP2166363.1 hypothetical protein [Goodfellowiella coeruleoviolacea]